MESITLGNRTWEEMVRAKHYRQKKDVKQTINSDLPELEGTRPCSVVVLGVPKGEYEVEWAEISWV